MNIKKIKIVLICAILASCLCLLTGCKNKTNEDEWLKNMERVSYIKLRGNNEKMLDNTLAKIIIENYDKSTDKEWFLPNENGSALGNMFYFYDDKDNLLFQLQCDYDGYHSEFICVMVANRVDGKYQYKYHTFKSKKSVEYINNIIKTN